MSARERLADMIRTDRGDMNVYSEIEVRAALDDHRAEVLAEAAAALEADMERFFAVWTDEPRNSPYALGHKDASDELRHMASVPRAKTDEATS